MSWLDIVSDNAASLIVAGSTIAVTALTLRSNRKGEASRLAQEERIKANELAHAQEMRFLEERIRIANQIIEQVSYGVRFLFQKNKAFATWNMFSYKNIDELITGEETDEITNCRVTVMALAQQLGDKELVTLAREWDTVMWRFNNVLSEAKRSEDGKEVFDTAMGDAFHLSNRFLSEIGEVIGIALPPKAS